MNRLLSNSARLIIYRLWQITVLVGIREMVTVECWFINVS